MRAPVGKAINVVETEDVPEPVTRPDQILSVLDLEPLISHAILSTSQSERSTT